MKTYIRQFYQSGGIRLDKDSIRYNSAKRGLVTLNSMWGKLREETDHRQNYFRTQKIVPISGDAGNRST
jgi:hypothetical protein